MLFASGRVVSLGPSRFQGLVANVLPTAVASTSNGSSYRIGVGTGAGKREHQEDEIRVRSLLDQISQVSVQSAIVQRQSRTIDGQLEALRSALEVQRIARTNGT